MSLKTTPTKVRNNGHFLVHIIPIVILLKQIIIKDSAEGITYVFFIPQSNWFLKFTIMARYLSFYNNNNNLPFPVSY